MNYFQSILKYFWNVQYGTRHINTDITCMAYMGMLLLLRICLVLRCFHFKNRHYNNRAVADNSRENNTRGVLRVAKRFSNVTMTSKFGIIHDRSYWNLLNTIVTFTGGVQGL